MHVIHASRADPSTGGVSVTFLTGSLGDCDGDITVWYAHGLPVWAVGFELHFLLATETGNLGSGPASVRHDPTRPGSGWTLNFPILLQYSP